MSQYSYFAEKLDLEFKMCLPTSSEGPIEVVEAQTVMKMLPNCIPMSQKQIENLITKT